MSKTIMGSETEYGIFAPRTQNSEYVLACLMLRFCPFPHFSRSLDEKWNRMDSDFQIGADVMSKLLSDPKNLSDEDKEWFKEHFGLSLDKSSDALFGAWGIQMENGARFYVDMSHPEFSTPEVTNARGLLLYEKAGEMIVEASRAKASQEAGCEIKIYKNNSDGKANSYACHENYLVPTMLFRKLVDEYGRDYNYHSRFRADDPYARPPSVSPAEVLMAFFVSRPIICGAGKIGVEQEADYRPPTLKAERFSRYIDLDEGYEPCGVIAPQESARADNPDRPSSAKAANFLKAGPYAFQISQRADFFVRKFSGETTRRRGIINTRDRSYVNHGDFSRFHVIVGDSNMSEWSIFLKTGATALVLDMLSDDDFVQNQFARVCLKDPVEALHAVSLDLTCKKPVIEMKDGRRVSALDVQKEFLAAIKTFRGGNLTPVEADVIEKWSYALDALENDPSRLDDKIDWRIKKKIFDGYLGKYRTTWEKCGARTIRLKGRLENLGYWLKQLDIEYHNTNPEKGIYHILLKKGGIKRIVGEEEIKNAVINPPEDTRAYLRGLLVKYFPTLIRDIHWHLVDLAGLGEIKINPFFGTKEVIDAFLRQLNLSR